MRRRATATIAGHAAADRRRSSASAHRRHVRRAVSGHSAGRGPDAGIPAPRQPRRVNAIVQFVSDGRTGHAAAAARPRRSRRSSTPYRFTGYRKFLDPDGYPAVAPPWGTLNAINLNTGDIAWQIPLGEYPELVGEGTDEHRQRELRRADRHGRRARVHRAPRTTTGSSARSTRPPARCSGRRRCRPRATRRRRPTKSNGRQFVVIAAGGGKGGRATGCGQCIWRDLRGVCAPPLSSSWRSEARASQKSLQRKSLIAADERRGHEFARPLERAALWATNDSRWRAPAGVSSSACTRRRFGSAGSRSTTRSSPVD